MASQVQKRPSSYADYLDFQRRNDVFSGLAAHSLMFANLNWESGSELLIGEVVSGNYFDVLGIRPRLGRFFNPEENATEGTHPVAVLSYGFWEKRFASDPALAGRMVRLNGKGYTIVGVAPRSFRGAAHGLAAQLWIPAMMAEEIEPVGLQDSAKSASGTTIIERRGRRWLFLKGRLKPEVSLEQAEAQMKTIMARLEQAYPLSNHGRTVNLLPSSQVRIHPAIDGALAPAGGFLLAAVGLVLLIACANLANMFLARASSRRREIALRLALGAARGRLVRQLLTESLLMALTGGALGLLLSYWGTRLLLSIRPPVNLSLELNADPDVRVLAFALLASLGAGILFGLLPALQSARCDLVPELKDCPRDLHKGGRFFGLRRMLVVAQVALSMVLLVGAGLLTRSLQSARLLEVGFQPQGLSFLTFDLKMHGYQALQARRFYEDLLERARSLPGVASAAVVSRMPFSLNFHEGEFYIGQRERHDEPGLMFDVTAVSPEYFKTLGVALLQGRDFSSQDRQGSTPAVIINQALARRHWPAESALGKRLTRRDGPAYEVVGVSGDYKIRSVAEEPRPVVHFARSQYFHPSASLLVRSLEGTSMLAPLRRQAQALEPEILIMQSTTMQGEIEITLFGVRLGATLLGVFSLFALFLASVGLYGVIAFSVAGRTREIGTRMALGAARRDVLQLVVREGMVLVMAGLLVGLAAAAALGRTLSSALYGISPVDAFSFGLAALVLAAVALAANLIPARRASRVDPMVALRYE
ncbi:MAG: ABC transporter permease [Acidobacteriota bacterium]